jgi:hypothetical protein
VAVLRCTLFVELSITGHKIHHHHHPSSNSGKHWNQFNSIQVSLSGSVHGPCSSSDAVRPLIVRSGVGFWDVLGTPLKRVQAE